MPSSCPSEERFPLLLLFLEDGQRASKRGRILFDKGRYHGITSGATAVITQWPGHLTTCWLTALVMGLTAILVFMIAFAISLHQGSYFLAARCRNMHVIDKDNRSALVHLVHNPSSWTHDQLEALDEIARNYRHSTIELILIQNEIDRPTDETQQHPESSTLPPSVTEQDDQTSATDMEAKTSTPVELRRVKRIKRHPNHKAHYDPWENLQLQINIGTKKLLKMLLHRKDLKRPTAVSYTPEKLKITAKKRKARSIKDIIKTYPNILVKNSTYEQIFKHTPLYFSWQNLNQATRLFAIRVLQMWNFAGITFNLPDLSKFPNNNINSTSLEGNYRKLISVGMSSFENLPEGLVTVDDGGLHMETKTICHAFFGELLAKLKHADFETTPADIMRKTLSSFCRRGAVDPQYCKDMES